MDVLIKIGQVLAIIIVIYLWNKFIIKRLIMKVTDFHRTNNSENTLKQPIKFFVVNELKIIKFAQYFYWFGAIIMSIGILFN
jgi:hypothetical protein